MQKLMEFVKRTIILSTIFVLAFISPASVAAQESTETTEGTASTTTVEQEPEQNNEESAVATEPTPPAAPSAPTGPVAPTGPTEPTGPQSPTGAESPTYIQNEDGTWENEHYVWDPATGQTKPKTAPSYSYNPETGMWDTTEWYYRPETGRYEANTISVAQNPFSALGLQGGNSIANTGPGSNNTIQDGSTLNGTFDLFYNTNISNRFNSTANSGHALVQGNTLAGNALSGDATVMANILNLLQSSWFNQSSDIGTFIANLDGNIFGDLVIDPSQLGGGYANNNIDVNIANNASIDNEIDLAATSGDATVSGNTEGGDAITGSARALLNLFNLINSSISSDRSFIGILNINGDLNGDILLPEGLLEFLIASTGPNSNNQISGGQNNNLNVDIERNRSIINDVTADAGSGDALVDHNTSAGSATSGDADTEVNTMNLVGQNVNAKNGLLVFINVFGQWVGLLFNAPQGTNAIATTGPSSNNTIDTSGNNNVSVRGEENSLINNDIDVQAQSGDASVTNNTLAGNATSGDASVGINILNMVDSNLVLSDWFGVLFINVFGSWNGSFGVDTPSGDAPVASSNSGHQGVFQFSPATTQDSSATPPSRSAGSLGTASSIFGATIETAADQQGAVSSGATSVNNGGDSGSGSTQAATSTQGQNLNLVIPMIGALLAILLLAGERVVLVVRERFAHA